MREKGILAGITKDLEGDLLVSFKVNNDPAIVDDLKKLTGANLIITAEKESKRRSLDANAYFWQLCDKIAKKLGNDKETIYLMMLQSAGVFVDVSIIPEAYEMLKTTYRLCERLNDIRVETENGSIDMVTVRCYLGSHSYSVDEMRDLINYTVSQATDLGIETLATEELNKMMALFARNCGKRETK